MKKLAIVIISCIVFLSNTNLYGCTGFCISKNDKVFVGNNEDWKNPNTKMWYEPGTDNTFGRIYFGFDNFFPQGGMNDQGLCFDGFATEFKAVTQTLDRPKFKGDNFLDYLMSNCATVEQVVHIFNTYNIEGLERAMLFFADATGDAAIIEGDEIIRKKEDYQMVTNFYQSEVKGDNVFCQRFKIANQLLKETEVNSIEFCEQVLAATHQEGNYPTVYSNIYDLKNKVVYVYHFHNFLNKVTIDLAKELEKGSRKVDLPDLFPKTYATETFKNNYTGATN